MSFAGRSSDPPALTLTRRSSFIGESRIHESGNPRIRESDSADSRFAGLPDSGFADQG
jgi:hypothetical protein